MKKTRSHQHNPALDHLEVLVGDWKMELSNAAFLPSRSDTVTGRVSFDWVESGAYLVMHMGSKPRGTPDALWLIGRDESSPNYTVLYYDARNVSRVYMMSFSAGRWKMWRNSPGFSQRFEGRLSEDGQTITADWEKSFDDKKWEHDFSITYTRLKPKRIAN